MLHDSFMSRANTIVVPGGKMELAMQLIFTPFIWRMMERRQRALGSALTGDVDDELNSDDRVTRADNGQRNDMANALRAIAMDAVQHANSGHPGAPMGMADMARGAVGRPPAPQPGQPAAGPTATASCCPTAMRRCCCMRCCI